MAVSSARSERVTVTMPAELVAGIDRYASNRSRFIAEAVCQELKRRRRQALLQSLDDPHPDSLETAAVGLQPGETACLWRMERCSTPPPGCRCTGCPVKAGRSLSHDAP